MLSFTIQLSHPYITTGKTIALTRWMFVGKVMFLLFNMLSSLVLNFYSEEQVSFNIIELMMPYYHLILYCYLLLLSLIFSIIRVFSSESALCIRWLQSPPTVIVESRKIKFVTVSIFSPSICHEVMGPDAMILVF